MTRMWWQHRSARRLFNPFVLGALALAGCTSGSDGDAPATMSGGGMGNMLGGTGATGGMTGGTGGQSSAGTSGNAGAAGLGGSSGAVGGDPGGNGGLGGSGALGGGDAGDGGIATGCSSSNLLPLPEDMKQRGPWDVGVRTVTVGRLTVEVMYPALPGSTAGVAEATYDIRDWLPPSERMKVPDAASPAVKPIGGKLFRDVPIDSEHGPYPLVVMIHGTSSFRIASGSTNVHWASRGFVVLAADYPGLGLADQLSATFECSLPQSGEQDIPGDVAAQIAAVEAGSGELELIAPHVDSSRIGLAGHSQGACMAALLANLPNVQIIVPMTGSTVPSPSTSLKSSLWIAGMDDTVIGYDTPLIGNVVCPANPLPATSNMDAYLASPGPPEAKKRIVGIQGGGHLVPSDLCQTNAQGRNAIAEAQLDGVCGIDSAVIIGLPALFDCGTIDYMVGVEAVSYATTAALEETLHCMDRSAQFEQLRAALPQVGDFQESL